MMIKKELVTKVCPNCSIKFEKTINKQGEWLSYYTDYTIFPTGRWDKKNIKTFTCQECNYLFYDENKFFPKELLNSYINSEEYKYIVKKYCNSEFLVIYHIYKHFKQTQDDLLKLLVYNYQQRYKSNMLDFKLLIDTYKEYSSPSDIKDEKYIFFHMLIGEYNRRNGYFDKAKEVFTEIKYILELNSEYADIFTEMCDFQFELIANKDNELRILNYVYLHPKHLWAQRYKCTSDKEINTKIIVKWMDGDKKDASMPTLN